MEEQGEVRVEEVLYEIRDHGNMVFTSDSFKQEVTRDSKEGWMSYLSFKGAKQLKEKWTRYKRPKSSNRISCLFVSQGGEYIAVAIGHKITILQKNDGYKQPIGFFTSTDMLSVFTSGAWLEPLGILGVISDMSTLILLKSSGEELARRTSSQLKLSAPIINLISLNNPSSEESFRHVFCLCTEDGLLYYVDTSQEPSACIRPISILPNYIANKNRVPKKVSCLDFHSDQRFGVLVDSSIDSGSCSVFIFRLTQNLEVKIIFCFPQFDGVFSTSKEYTYPYCMTKVSISPHAKHVAINDLTGRTSVFSLDTEKTSLSHVSSPLEIDKSLIGNSDISWWTDNILVVAKRDGIISMHNIINGRKVMDHGLKADIAAVERSNIYQEHVFVLESSLPNDNMALNENLFHIERSVWRLLSLVGKSVSEMYSFLICSQQYQSALEFADRHKLDKNEVYKAQWLNSNQEIQEINFILPKITDRMFVLSECLDKVGPTEDSVKSLLSYGLQITEDYRFVDASNDSEIWEILALRLQLLQYRDKLETFVGINTGRFYAREYKKFRAVPLVETATSLAESGKIGALNLLFKRHPYSLCPQILHILSSIPETVPVQSYGQLLPGRSPPDVMSLREVDWVECVNTISYLCNLPSNSDVLHLKTENILKLSMGLVWPSIADLTEWYKNRACDIDYLSGQVDNCLSLLDFACNSKGIMELQQFLEDTLYLNQLIYSIGSEEDFTMNLIAWEQMSDYEKFKVMLKGVRDETVVKRLQDLAVPFMNKRSAKESESYIVRWLKETALENQLEVCLAVIENGCSDVTINGLFKDESEIVETALDCIYLCTLTDQWNVMASMLSILPRKIVREKTDKEFNSKYSTQSLGIPRFSYLRSRATDEKVELHDSRETMNCVDNNSFDDNLEKQIKVVVGHVEVGRLLAFYQVPKPMSFFLSSQTDEKEIKQLIRLILSKFGRRQPAKSDNDWANMWRDMQCFQEKAFPCLDSEHMLIEFCRGLLKAGKFSLARNYLKGTSSISLATEKAESLVIQAAREYFFSASSLSCLEVWKAKECLSLLPNSKLVQVESNIIEALTERLPNLGVTLLPVEFKQIKDPLEIIYRVISSQPGTYLNVDEIIEIAKLLGIDSPENIATVEETIAREAAVAGDLQLAFDLCLVLAKKGHGQIWDLCAAIARGPHLENMDASSRKQLLSFALCHCDEESIGELLNAWKDVDIHMQCENLIITTKTNPPNYSVQGSLAIPLPVQSVHDIFDLIHGAVSDDNQYSNIKATLSKVGKELTLVEDGISWDSLLRENRKVLSFAALELPWLVELSEKEEYGRKESERYVSIQTQALISTICWLANNDIAPNDDLLASIARSIMKPPASKDEDVLGCSFLLNLVDAVKGVEIIEEQMKQRTGYQEMFNIMNIGMLYSSLQNLHRECLNPNERRNLLICKFREKQASFSSDKQEQIDEAQSTFWREWKLRLEEQKRIANEARSLEQTIPGVETARFLSGDAEYKRSVVYSFVDSVKAEKKHILKEAVTLADMYGLNRNEVLLRFFGCALVSNHWDNDDILKEIAEYREDIVKCAKEVIDMISCIVYPEISGYNKQRLSYIYSILSACHLRLKRTDEKLSATVSHQYPQHKKHKLEPFEFYKVLEKECQKVSMINDLNFKNIAVLDDLNFDNFNEEVSANINELTVETLADMTRAVFSMYDHSEATTTLMSWQDVYKTYIQGNTSYLEKEVESISENNVSADDLQEIVRKIEANYENCKKYIKLLSELDQLNIIRRYFYLCTLPCSSSLISFEGCTQIEVLFTLLNFFIKMAHEGASMVRLAKCFVVLKELLTEGKISVECMWSTITNYCKIVLNSCLTMDISILLEAMIFSGCGYYVVSKVYSGAELHETSLKPDMKINNLLDLYLYNTERSLLALSRGSQHNQNLHYLLSSLSKFDCDQFSDDLSSIRHRVWQKLTAFSEDMELESQIRVHALELMQAITGQNITNLPAKLVSMIQPWEAWEQTCTTTSSTTANTLVALKSTRLVSAISPKFEISAEDLATLDTAVSCFLRLCGMATSLPHIVVLKAVLDEWEVLFHTDQQPTENLETAVEEPNNWSSDEWDNEGWEDNFPEETAIKNEDNNAKKQFSVRPLHSCWMEIMKKLVVFSKIETVVELLDKSHSKIDSHAVLIDEDEAKCLYQFVSSIDGLSALKIVLLLPYKEIQLQCLPELSSKCDISVDHGYEILIVLLLSETLKDIMTNPNLGKTFSCLCHLVGYLVRHVHERLCREMDVSDNRMEMLFCSIILPCFISQLIESGEVLLAGFIVSQSMHTHSSLSLLDIAQTSLTKYLEGKVSTSIQQPESDLESCGSLKRSLWLLRGKAKGMIESAISTLR